MKRIWTILKRLNSDERGSEGLEKLLIIAAIVLPLLGLLIVFRGKLTDWVTQAWDEMKGQSGNTP